MQFCTFFKRPNAPVGQIALATVVGLAVVNTVPARAEPTWTDSVQQDVQSVVGGDGNVNVTVDNGIATLTGYVRDGGVGLAAENAALRHDEVNEVVDLMF